ncbi:hypothetical protein ACFFX0_28605 [Citricoccus parietis]|uniref:Uncharacterized protein n=1 Tax=Citricoccus parietis TaxID=592307 RepID=A0ABV5G7K5_9MICC
MAASMDICLSLRLTPDRLHPVRPPAESSPSYSALANPASSTHPCVTSGDPLLRHIAPCQGRNGSKARA